MCHTLRAAQPQPSTKVTFLLCSSINHFRLHGSPETNKFKDSQINFGDASEPCERNVKKILTVHGPSPELNPSEPWAGALGQAGWTNTSATSTAWKEEGGLQTSRGAVVFKGKGVFSGDRWWLVLCVSLTGPRGTRYLAERFSGCVQEGVSGWD